MTIYLLIAVGGAIGSVLRAWVGAIMIGLTGPLFPWGTILINILGSFLIGWFGTLTATDGRFAASAELRAFVMVGICGGFTTFSSFSLQTLDLLRDGRPAQALANVLLSVMICLGAVALGYTSAMTLRRSTLASVSLPAPGELAGRTLVALYRPESVASMLASADRLMSRAPGSQTVALAVEGPALSDLRLTEELLTAERRAEIVARRQDWTATMKPALDDWVRAERARGHRASWMAAKGDGVAPIVEHSRSAHLLLLEHDPADPGTRQRVEAALRQAHRPLLLIPSGHPAADLGRIVVIRLRPGQSLDQARAEIALLAQAERVIAVSPEAAQATADGLLARAGEEGADLLILSLGPQEGQSDLLVDTVTSSARLAVLIHHQPRHSAQA